ncbi:MAG: intradiol ring-cleavage dioxygenase [Sphingomonas sp.]
MRDPNETSITAAVIERVEQASDPRAREISAALVRQLHAFILEVRPSVAEWEAGIRFLTDVGRMCSETRQEFILLSDTLGVSMLVDSINHPASDDATETTVFGPFYVEAPEFANGADISGRLTGTPMYVDGTVRGARNQALPGAVVDVWHSDEAGYYDLQTVDVGAGLAGRGRFRTNRDGQFSFWTVRPAAYPIPDDGPVGRMLKAQGRHPFRPEHVHFMIQAPGYRKLVTHIFAEGDKYLDSDVVFGVKASLIQPCIAHEGGRAPDGRQMTGAWFRLHRDFTLRAEAPTQRTDVLP